MSGASLFVNQLQSREELQPGKGEFLRLFVYIGNVYLVAKEVMLTEESIVSQNVASASARKF